MIANIRNLSKRDYDAINSLPSSPNFIQVGSFSRFDNSIDDDLFFKYILQTLYSCR